MSDLPRLLLCCFDVVPAPTAISRRMTEYLKGLSDRFQVVVLTVKTPDHTHIERYHGARLLRVPVGSGDLAARVQSFDRAVRRQLDSEEYVMVHAFDPFGGYALCERRSEFGYKVVYDACALPSVDLPSLHDEAEANRRFIARVRRQELFCLMNADSVIVANELTREFVTGLGVSREQTMVLPCPVDLTPYKPEVMGLPDATPMKLVHVGNLSTANDLPTVLEAMQLALQSVDLGLTVVGPRHPAHQARLEERIAALKLTGKVEFQDPVTHDDLHKVLATTDVGLLSLTDSERNMKVGSPLSRAAEYLAAGRPVIAADVASARATLQEEGVVFYKPGDKQSLADALIALASEPARRVKLGKAARNEALAHDGAIVRADLVATYVTLTGTGNRAVGDAETTSPDEVTQLGQSLGAEDTKERKRKAAALAAAAGEKRSASGEQKVATDPAIAAADTSPEAALRDRPAVMGVPIREEDEPPIVLGKEAREVVNEIVQQVTTEPNALLRTEPPVVMGMPLPQQPLAVTTIPAMMTPGDLAAELGKIDEPLIPHSSPTIAATTDPTTGAPLADDLPDTGAHLSLVPKDPPPPATRTSKSASSLGPVPETPARRGRASRASKSLGKTGESGQNLTPVGDAPKKIAEASQSVTPSDGGTPLSEQSGSTKRKTDPAATTDEKSGVGKRLTDPAATTDEKSASGRKLTDPSITADAEKSASGRKLTNPSTDAEKSASGRKLTDPSITGDAEKSASGRKLTDPSITTGDAEKSASGRKVAEPAPADAEKSASGRKVTDPSITGDAEKSASGRKVTDPSITGDAEKSASGRKLAEPAPTEAEKSASGRKLADPTSAAEKSASRRVPDSAITSDAEKRSTLTPTLSLAGEGEPLRVESTVPYGQKLEPPPLPRPSTPGGIFIPPLEMPSVATPVPRSSTSGLTPAFRSSPSGSALPIVPAVAPPPQFVPLLTPPTPGVATPAPKTVIPPMPFPRTASGTFATLATTPAAPPPLPSLVTPPALTNIPAGARPSGLFPEAPAVPLKPFKPTEPQVISDSEIEEVGDEGPEELDDEELVEVPTNPTPVMPGPSQTSDEAPEVAPEDAGVQTVDTDASPPPSAIDPWLAMLVHGYCPPASGLFNRHTPPTTMPGRDR
ncbi:MAG: glycosyltransferase [Archangium sp.]